MTLTTLFTALCAYHGPNVFNQYASVDPAYDIPGADGIRLENLKAYLKIFSRAKVVLVGEAPSFHGCRFSGIPFMSEELLMGQRRLTWAGEGVFRRTSIRPRPMSEHSASIVWETFAGRTDIVLWNAFPWHTFKQGAPETNRRPTRDEVLRSADVLNIFLGLFPECKVLAVGRTAESALDAVGVPASYIRHPAMGGKRAFMEGIARI